MPNLRVTCPSCGIRERIPITAIRTFKIMDGRRVPSSPSGASILAASAICDECQTPFGLLVHPYASTVQELLGTNTSESTDAALRGAVIVTNPPSPLAVVPNDALPVLVREPFVFIQEDAIRRRNPTGIMSGARSCLDVVLKDLGQNSGGRRSRIQNLCNEKIITQSIADWAQKLWEDGNDATHDLTANIDRAIEHVEFLKLFFEVVYALPKRIAAATTTPDSA
jgi:hypothetical protein